MELAEKKPVVPSTSIKPMKINNTCNLLKLTLFLSVLFLTTGIQPIKALPDGLDQPIADNPSRPGSTRHQETPDEVLQPGAIRDPIDGTSRGQGGSRGECDRPDTYNTPPTLIASSSSNSLTTNSEPPRFYVYVPFVLRERDPGMFTLMDENGRIVDQQEFRNFPDTSMFTIEDEDGRIVDREEFLDSPDTSMFTIKDENGRIVDQQEFLDLLDGGILEISSNYQLQVGQTYEWFFEVFCNDPTMSNSTDNSFSESSTIRRELSGSSNNSFYDQLQAAADSKRQGNSTDWNNLLESIGLSRRLIDEDIIRP